MERPPKAVEESKPASAGSERIRELKSLILTNEQYREHSFATNTEGNRTYVYEIVSGEKTLTYFGSTHTNDAESLVFDEIHQAFEKANPEVVYVEGMEFINHHKGAVREKFAGVTPKEAKKQGENYYTLKLAVDSGADFESPEFNRADEIRQLIESGFSHEDIFSFYFARPVYGYQRQAKEPSKEECLQYISRNMKAFREATSWSQEEIDSLEEKASADLNIEDEVTYQSSVDPIPWEGKDSTVTNEISRRLSLLRDEYQFGRIAESLEKYDRIFVVYGSAHAVKLEPALRELL